MARVFQLIKFPWFGSASAFATSRIPGNIPTRNQLPPLNACNIWRGICFLIQNKFKLYLNCFSAVGTTFRLLKVCPGFRGNLIVSSVSTQDYAVFDKLLGHFTVRLTKRLVRSPQKRSTVKGGTEQTQAESVWRMRSAKGCKIPQQHSARESI